MKQSPLAHCFCLNGLDVCSWLFNVFPLRSTTFNLRPLFRISFSYILFSFPSGVIVVKSTVSKPPFRYQSFLFSSFSVLLSSLLQFLGRCIGRIPNCSFSRIFMYALIADLTTWYRISFLYPEYCIFIMNLLM